MSDVPVDRVARSRPGLVDKEAPIAAYIRYIRTPGTTHRVDISAEQLRDTVVPCAELQNDPLDLRLSENVIRARLELHHRRGRRAHMPVGSTADWMLPKIPGVDLLWVESFKE